MNFLEGANQYMIFFTAVVLIGIGFSFRPIMRRILKADKVKFFAWENYVNKIHKRIDWIIRIATLIGIIILFGFQTSILNDGGGLKWYLGPHMALFIMIPFVELLRAYMEWRYSENRSNFKVTLLELGFLGLLTFICLSTGFFGAFEFSLYN